MTAGRLPVAPQWPHRCRVRVLPGPCQTMPACDFFTVDTVLLRRIYVFLRHRGRHPPGPHSRTHQASDGAHMLRTVASVSAVGEAGGCSNAAPAMCNQMCSQDRVESGGIGET